MQVAVSSTVLPYASIVAEASGENFDFTRTVFESGSSSVDLKRFCKGVGENTIDVANASHQIREKGVASCAANGVSDIIEVRVSYGGIVFLSDINRASFAFIPEN